MIRYFIKRLILIIVSLFIVMSLLFLLTRLAMLRIWALPHPFIEDVHIAWQDYIVYMKNVINDWDWGTTANRMPVWLVVTEKLKITLKYNLVALVVYFFGGVSLGVVAAYYKNKFIDNIISFFTMLFNSIPGFVLIFFLIIVLAYSVRWLPAQEPFANADLARKLKGLIIPVIALSVGPMGRIAQLVRGELIESIQSQQYLLLRSKGLTKKQALIRHGIKDSLVVLLPEIIPMFVFVINMSFVIEYTYNINGIAQLFVKSVISFGNDYNAVVINTPIAVTIGTLLYTIILVFALISDMTLALLDPRIKIRSKKTK
ncbi:MAG: ABC transporter permease [Bacillota bacterium]